MSVKLKPIVFLSIILSWALGASLHAAEEAGDSTANLYHSNPDEYIGERVNIEISHIKVVPAVKGIDGLTFFFAQTYDFDNNCNGGEMLVIVKAEDADRLRRKFGTIVDKDGKGEPETKRLRGTLRMVGDSMLFIEYPDDEDIHSVVQAHYDETNPTHKS